MLQSCPPPFLAHGCLFGKMSGGKILHFQLYQTFRTVPYCAFRHERALLNLNILACMGLGLQLRLGLVFLLLQIL